MLDFQVQAVITSECYDAHCLFGFQPKVKTEKSEKISLKNEFNTIFAVIQLQPASACDFRFFSVFLNIS